MPPEMVAERLFVEMHLDLFWHTYNYSAHLLQELLNVAWKASKVHLEVEEGKNE